MAYRIAGDSSPPSVSDRSQDFHVKRSCRGKKIDFERSGSPQPGHIQTADSLSCSIGRGRGRGRGRGNIACRTVVTVDPPGKRNAPFTMEVSFPSPRSDGNDISRSWLFDEGAAKLPPLAGLPEDGFEDAPDFHFHTEGLSDKAPDEYDMLESAIRKLGLIKKGDQRLRSFNQEYSEAAHTLFQTVLRNPLHPGTQKKCTILLKYAEVFRFGDVSKTALLWYGRINSCLYECLSPKQRGIFNENFMSLLDFMVEDYFDHKFSQINKQYIPERYRLLMDVFQSQRAYDLLPPDLKGKIIAIACRIIVARRSDDMAEKLLGYTSHDELKGNCTSYEKTTHPIWWVARFLWIAAVGVLRQQSKMQFKQMIIEAENAAWTIPEDVWVDSNYGHIPQSYYQMRQTGFEYCLTGQNPNDERDLRRYIHDVRIDYPRVCKSVERQKVMLANGIELLCHMLLRQERLNEVDKLIAELESIQHAKIEEKERVGIAVIKAERTRIEYNKSKKEEKDTGRLISLRERIGQYIEIMTSQMKRTHFSSAVTSCLGKLYFELENWKEAEEAFSKYTGHAALCIRLHAICLGHLGEYQRASDMLHQLETRGREEDALFSIYHEHAVTLSLWIESGVPMPGDIIQKALKKCRNAVEVGRVNWSAPWNAIGHICETLHKRGDQTFARTKHSLIEPINQCGSWGDASAIAFLIANSEKPSEARDQIKKAGPKKYRGLLMKQAD